MMQLRPFRNDDSPGVVAVWNEQPPIRGRLAKLSTTILEQHVLSKPYFDPQGLIVAEESERMIGFVHVGFTPSVHSAELVRESGVISLLMVRCQENAKTVARKLLDEGEKWLRERGAKDFLGGGAGLHAPFYLGLYGGCRLPGVLVGDTTLIDVLQAAGYMEHLPFQIWHRALNTFRVPVERAWLALKRQYKLNGLSDDPVKDWDDACAFSWTDPIVFGIDPITTGDRAGSLTFWNMEPLASGWGQRAMGLAECSMTGKAATALLPCFLAEALRQFQSEGVALVEIQTQPNDEELLQACQKLGFQSIDRGVQFRKPAG